MTRSAKLSAAILVLAIWSSPATGGMMPEVPYSPLIDAVEKGDAEEVASILSTSGIQDRDRCRMDKSLASIAAERGDVVILKALLSAGASVSDKECRGSSPLYEAAEQGHADAVAMLLAKKADVRFRVGNGSTPLLASLQGPLFQVGPEGDVKRTVELLLKAGSDPNAANTFSNTPLIVAVRRADSRIVAALLKHRADPKRKNKDGLTPLDLARKEELAFIAGLLEGKGLPKPGAQGQKLIDAASKGDEAAVSKLLAAKAPVNGIDIGGNTPLIHAAYLGKEEMGLAILGKGADPLVKNARNDTALHYAGARGLPRLAAALLDKGADLRAQDYYGNSCLSYAVREGKAETAALLLSRGADPEEKNPKDEKGLTLLMEMAVKGDEAMVRILVEGKAPVDSVDKEGLTALMHAAGEGKTGVVEALLKAGADPARKDSEGKNTINHALGGGHGELVPLFTARGAKPDGGALLTALRNWDPAVVSSLLQQGVSPHPQGTEVPLALAAGSYKNKTELTGILLKAGAKPNIADSEGMTPLMHASRWAGEDSVGAVKALLKAGADHNAKDKKGMTAWTHAMINGSNDTAAVLTKAGADEEYEALAWEGSFVKDVPRQAMAVTDQKAWDDIWKKLGKDPVSPAIDFKHYAVACVFLGDIPGSDTGGVVFKEPKLEGKTLRVDYKVVPRGYITDVSATSPYGIKVVKRSGAKDIVLPAPPDLSETPDSIRGQLEDPVQR